VQGTDQMPGSVDCYTITSSRVSLRVNEDMQLLGVINIARCVFLLPAVTA
jgi:hypothetical protein